MYLLISFLGLTEEAAEESLHSTMYLLIFSSLPFFLYFLNCFTFHYVSINIERSSYFNDYRSDFTFHYVSINMRLNSLAEIADATLHSTMYLLIFVQFVVCVHIVSLYIPLCIY